MEKPDYWQIIKITNMDGIVIHKVLAGWASSYLSGPSWRLNSGIIRIEKKGKVYRIHGNSGSIYDCYEDYEGLNGYTNSVLDGMMESARKAGATIEPILIETILHLHKKEQK